MMQIHREDHNGVPVMVLQGQFNALGAAAFDEEVSCLGLSVRFVIVDFAECQFLTSAGIRSLIKLEKKLLERNGHVLLIQMTDSTMQVLEISGLLHQLRLFTTFEEAVTWIGAAHDREGRTVQCGISGHTYRCSRLSQEAATLELWDASQPDGPFHASLSELTLATGTGALAHDRQKAVMLRGPFLSAPSFFGFVPFDTELPFDYMVTARPHETGVFIERAFNISGKPSLTAEFNEEHPVQYASVIADIFVLLRQKLNIVPPVIGVLLYGLSESDPEKIREIEKKECCLISFAVAVNEAGLADMEHDKLKEMLSKVSLSPVTPDTGYTGVGALLSMSQEIMDYTDITNSIQSFVDSENVSVIVPLAPEMKIGRARIWVFIPDDIVSATERRLRIETTIGLDVPDEWEMIIRNVYRDCSRVVLDPIHGGFSARTFHVTSFDREGRRRLPTVLKLAGIDIIDREEKNYNMYVKNYILNNSTSIMGTYRYGDWKGLCYSFVGINGPDSTVTWLTHLYKSRSSIQLTPIFDRIFTDILRPWYGQPRLETIYPFRDHNPLKTFFPQLLKTAEDALGITSTEKTVFISELGRDIINPYWYLQNEFKRRENDARLWYTCITHRDLNMQNILLDEVENIYIIDFSETQPGNAVADFARLEPILKMEMCRIENEEDMKALVEFEEGLLQPVRLNEKPVFQYHGTDTGVAKAYEIITRLRQYADRVTLFEEDILPYLLAVLEWTYPVVCYGNLNIFRKRYSAISAALICEKIMALEKSNPA